MTQQIAQQVMLPMQQTQQALGSPVRPGQIGPAHKAIPKRTRKNFIFYYSVDNDIVALFLCFTASGFSQGFFLA